MLIALYQSYYRAIYKQKQIISDMSNIKTPTDALKYLLGRFINESEQGGIEEYINELKGNGTFVDRKYYSIVSKDDFSNLNEGRDFIIKDSSDYAILEDQKRKKFKYKVVFDYNRHSHFINKDCLCLIDEIELIKDLGVNTVIIDCRFSGYKYSTQIISLYAQALRKDNNVDLKILKEQIESITMTRLNKGNFINGRIHEKPNKC